MHTLKDIPQCLSEHFEFSILGSIKADHADSHHDLTVCQRERAHVKF